MTTGSTSENGRSFEAFFECWLVRQEHLLDELRSAVETCHESSDDYLRDLIERVLRHYQQYYEEKSRMTNLNVFLVFSPPWFTPFERSFFWMAGFKPGLAFRLVETSLNDLTEDQNRRMEQLKKETKAVERRVEDAMARIQESVGERPLVELAKRAGRLPPTLDGEIESIDTVIESLRSAMKSVLGSADTLRTRTAERVVNILNPIQNVKFLAAATELQLRIRTWGLQKKATRLN